ncbi:MAG: RAD55 family ATPase [Candidatus Micrarchaeota archaeon]
MINLGIEKLDRLIGEIRKSSNILVMGPPGPEKMMVGMHYMNACVMDQQSCIYATSDISPSDIETRGKEIGLDFAAHVGKEITFIDCYSWALGTPPVRRNDIQVPGPNALDDMSISIAQAMDDIGSEENTKGSTRVIFHSLSTFLLYNNPEVTFRFIQITGARLKAAGCTTLYFLESGMHDNKIVVTVKHLMDSVIEIKNENNKNYITAPLHGLRKWVEFEVGKKGIKVV